MNFRIQVLILSLLLACPALRLAGQQHAPAAAPPSAEQAQAPNPNTAVDRELSTESKSAAGEEGEENAQFKRSKAVVWISEHVGISPEAGYWVFVCINFAIVAGFIFWASRTKLAMTFRTRTANIKKGIEEARKASAEANARLHDIEARLAKLDAQVADIRAAADADLAEEEQRIRLAAEEDARRVIESAESEIAAAAKSARRELKSYAADLAVGLAKQKIKIDPQTDAELLRAFADQLGKDGK